MNKIPNVVRNAVGEARCRYFDWRHGVRTCGGVNLVDLTLVGSSTDHGRGYYPSHPKFLFEVISSLNIDYPSYTFIDVGSGKGRVLLVASEFPFAEIIGVEFAKELHEIASRNIRDYRSKTQKCKNIKSVNVDAMEYELPLTPLVLYFFNPFRPPVFVPVLQRLQRSIDSHPREVIMLYETPCHADLVEEHTELRCVDESPWHKTYQFKPHS
jgi:hypothetical protein